MAVIKKGNIAKYKYNRIKYSNILIEPGEQHVLTSDPWAYLSSYLQKNLLGKRGKNKKNIERALYFCDLAEEFYSASINTNLPAKGTLVYYGMLNLVKCFLASKGITLEEKIEHHGLVMPLEKKPKIVAKAAMTDAVNVFLEFSRALGVDYASPINIKFTDLLGHIPEIHGIYTTLGLSNKRKLLPVNIDFLVNDACTRIFTEMSYKKEQETKVPFQSFLKGERKKYYKEGFARSGYVVYRSVSAKYYNNVNISVKYKNILKDYRKFNIVSILTREGYRYYVDLKPHKFHHLSCSLAAMFYIGSAARYRPLVINEIMDGELRPLISESVSLIPKQFLYHLVSLITEKECVIPFSAL